MTIYTYYAYFLERDTHDAAIKKGKKYTPSADYYRFRQHIVLIGALDLTDPETEKRIPHYYWKIAIMSNIQIFPTDYHYIKKLLYDTRPFNLVSPLIDKLPKIKNKKDKIYVGLKLLVAHQEMVNYYPLSNNLEFLLRSYMGALCRDYNFYLDNTNYTQREIPFIESWFEQTTRQ